MNKCACIWTVGAISVRGLLPVGTEHPVQITSAYSVCECVCEEGHRSLWQPGSCLLNDVGFIYEVMADVWEGGKKPKVRWGEMETARGCDIKISSRWWMSARVTLVRTAKRQLCNGRRVVSRIVGFPLCATERVGGVFWNLLDNVSASVISTCLIVNASGLMGQNRPVKR